jgi:hypothetical protein
VYHPPAHKSWNFLGRRSSSSHPPAKPSTCAISPNAALQISVPRCAKASSVGKKPRSDPIAGAAPGATACQEWTLGDIRYLASHGAAQHAIMADFAARRPGAGWSRRRRAGLRVIVWAETWHRRVHTVVGCAPRRSIRLRSRPPVTWRRGGTPSPTVTNGENSRIWLAGAPDGNLCRCLSVARPAASVGGTLRPVASRRSFASAGGNQHMQRCIEAWRGRRLQTGQRRIQPSNGLSCRFLASGRPSRSL